MARKNSVTQQQCTYVRNGFRTGINNVSMKYGLDIPVPPIYQHIITPLVDDIPGTIGKAYVATNSIITVTPNKVPFNAGDWSKLDKGAGVAYLDKEASVTFQAVSTIDTDKVYYINQPISISSSLGTGGVVTGVHPSTLTISFTGEAKDMTTGYASMLIRIVGSLGEASVIEDVVLTGVSGDSTTIYSGTSNNSFSSVNSVKVLSVKTPSTVSAVPTVKIVKLSATTNSTNVVFQSALTAAVTSQGLPLSWTIPLLPSINLLESPVIKLTDAKTGTNFVATNITQKTPDSLGSYDFIAQVPVMNLYVANYNKTTTGADGTAALLFEVRGYDSSRATLVDGYFYFSYEYGATKNTGRNGFSATLVQSGGTLPQMMSNIISIKQIIPTGALLTDFPGSGSIDVFTATANGTVNVSAVSVGGGTCVFYDPDASIIGSPLSLLDTQRCLTVSLVPNTNSYVSVPNVSMLITGYDDRNVKVQEQIRVPTSTKKGANVTFISNKAYSSIESIEFSGSMFSTSDPVANPILYGTGNIVIQASNTHFGLPIYFSHPNQIIGVPSYGDITQPGLEVGINVTNGWNFYASVPNANAISPLNSIPSTATDYIATYSDRDARGLVVLDIPLTSNSCSITVPLYIYAVDSFKAAQLQDNNLNVRQQTSNYITKTDKATVDYLYEIDGVNFLGWATYESEEYYTGAIATINPANWAVTEMTNLDLVGCQYPGDNAQFNQIFVLNPVLPARVRRPLLS